MTVKRDDGHPPWPIRSGTYREDVQPPGDTPQARLIAQWREQARLEYKAAKRYPAKAKTRTELLHDADAKMVCAHELEKACAGELAALDQPHQCEWKDAIIDACVVDWILTAEHESDPRKAINDLLGWQYKLALDPAVSEEAAKLHARIAELEAALDQTAPPKPREHEWQFYANGSFCKRCGTSIGSGIPCK